MKVQSSKLYNLRLQEFTSIITLIHKVKKKNNLTINKFQFRGTGVPWIVGYNIKALTTT